MPPLHVLIKPVSSLCNLRCEYCFYDDVADNRMVKSYGVMSEGTLEKIIAKSLAFAEGECTIAYQGGEPTLAGLDFFRHAMALQKKYNEKGFRIYNAIQTNGYQLGEDWARFFHDHSFLVGLSLDGVKETHDAYRADSRGKGTFQAVLKTAGLFNQYGVEYNILTVVNNLVARHAAAIYHFYKKNGFRYMQFIPCLDKMGRPFGGDGYSLTDTAYGRFLCTLFDQWYADFMRGDAVSVRDFDNYIQILLGYPPEACNMKGVCGLQYVIEADGSVYPCDFYALDEFRLGNLGDASFEEIDKKRQEIGFVKLSTGQDPSCAQCEYWSLCRGGCRRHRELNLCGKPGKTYFCEAYKGFFHNSLERMTEVARMYLLRQPIA